MKSMKVMRFNDSPDSPALIAGTVPIPGPNPGEILIRVHAAGVTPTELLWYPMTHLKDGTKRTGAVPGHEFSGVVEAVGTEVDPNLVAQEVYGMNDWFAEGASAEYCMSTPSAVAKKPSSLNHAEAATVPIGALTAWQGLFDRAHLRSGERILIHGGSGAVGAFAVQLARRAGAHVIATASTRNFDFLSNLGAHEMIDYHTSRFEESCGSVDVVFDAAGGETLKKSWGLLSPNGRMVTIAANSEGAKDERIEKAFFIVEPNHQHLTEIARLIDAGELRCSIAALVPLAKASDAYCGQLTERKARGKVVLSILS